MTRIAVLLTATAMATVISSASAIAQSIETYDTPVQSRIIENFKIGSDDKQFGRFEFAGGLEMVSSQQHFGALSGLVLDPNQLTMTAVADTGFWLKATLTRDTETRALTGVETAAMADMARADGTPLRDKWLADAEGLAATENGMMVSFEREHRIEAHRAEPKTGFFVLETIQQPPVPLKELRHNRGFEGIDIAPDTTPWPEALVGISEKSLDANGNIMGFVAPLNRPSFEFSLARIDGFDVTDLSFLPNGDLLILERRFTVQDGVAMRIRHISANAIEKGATIQPTIWLEADMRFQIDNMEGMTVSVDPDGTPRVTLVSDDNHSILQRNLLLEFRLAGPNPS